ncbi:hypothetical protein EBZ35_00725 [bacterium]|nr:hypothetical protein [bacterium]
MLTGLQKAKWLLSILGDRATAVLSLLSPSSAQKITSTIGDTPRVSASEANAFLMEVMERVSSAKQSVLDMPHGTFEDRDAFSESLSELGAETGEGDIFDFSDGSGGIGSDAFGGFESQSEIQVDQSSIGPVMRTPHEIADLLSHQKPQISAFILSKMEDTIREQVLDCIPLEAREHLESIRVDTVPLSDKVFKRIYDLVMFAPSHTPVSEDRGSFSFD